MNALKKLVFFCPSEEKSHEKNHIFCWLITHSLFSKWAKLILLMFSNRLMIHIKMYVVGIFLKTVFYIFGCFNVKSSVSSLFTLLMDEEREERKTSPLNFNLWCLKAVWPSSNKQQLQTSGIIFNGGSEVVCVQSQMMGWENHKHTGFNVKCWLHTRFKVLFNVAKR